MVNYFKLLREITLLDDDKITDAQAFALIVDMINRKTINNQPIVYDTHKEQILMGKILNCFERVNRCFLEKESPDSLNKLDVDIENLRKYLINYYKNN